MTGIEETKAAIMNFLKDMTSAYEVPTVFRERADGWITDYPEEGAPAFPLLMYMFIRVDERGMVTVDTRSNGGTEDDLYYRTVFKPDDEDIAEYLDAHIEWCGNHL